MRTLARQNDIHVGADQADIGPAGPRVDDFLKTRKRRLARFLRADRRLQLKDVGGGQRRHSEKPVVVAPGVPMIAIEAGGANVADQHPMRFDRLA
jgi:hypothetical protein